MHNTAYFCLRGSIRSFPTVIVKGYIPNAVFGVKVILRRVVFLRSQTGLVIVVQLTAPDSNSFPRCNKRAIRSSPGDLRKSRKISDQDQTSSENQGKYQSSSRLAPKIEEEIKPQNSSVHK